MSTNQGSHRLEIGDDGPAVAGTEHSDHKDHPDHPDRAGRPSEATVVEEKRVLPAKTSAAAVFALVFGLSALLAVLTIILAPLALVLALIGIVLGIIGMKMAKRVGVTGRGVARGGLILAVIALILSITVVAGATTVLNNKNAVDRLDKQVEKLRDKLPDKTSIPAK